MAVRAFDLTETQSARLTVVESAPLSRHDVRKSRHHWLLVGGACLIAPFVVAITVIGIAH